MTSNLPKPWVAVAICLMITRALAPGEAVAEDCCEESGAEATLSDSERAVADAYRASVSQSLGLPLPPGEQVSGTERHGRLTGGTPLPATGCLQRISELRGGRASLPYERMETADGERPACPPWEYELFPPRRPTRRTAAFHSAAFLMNFATDQRQTGRQSEGCAADNPNCGPGPLLVTEIGNPEGGESSAPRHAHHQNGTNVDICYPGSMQDFFTGGSHRDRARSGCPYFDPARRPEMVPRTLHMVRRMVEVGSRMSVLAESSCGEPTGSNLRGNPPNVLRYILVDTTVVAALCEHIRAMPDAQERETALEAMRFVMPADNHADHIHLAFRCQVTDPHCDLSADVVRSRRPGCS